MTALPAELAKLSIAEQRELMELLAQSIAEKEAQAEAVPLAHIEYIRRELEEMKQNPDAGLSMDEFLAQRR